MNIMVHYFEMSCAEFQVKKALKMGRRQTRSWACETGVPLGSKRHKNAMAWHVRSWAWHAKTLFQRATMGDTKGAWHA